MPIAFDRKEISLIWRQGNGKYPLPKIVQDTEGLCTIVIWDSVSIPNVRNPALFARASIGLLTTAVVCDLTTIHFVLSHSTVLLFSIGSQH